MITHSLSWLMVACALVIPATAQHRHFLSSHDSTTTWIASHAVTVTYGRPQARGRKMIGDHEPYGELWRLGADEATTIQTDTPWRLGDLQFKAGKYALFAIPYQDHFVVIVNSRWLSWGTFEYNQHEDAGRLQVPVIRRQQFTERLSIEIDPVAEGTSTTLRMLWENWAVEIPLEVQL